MNKLTANFNYVQATITPTVLAYANVDRQEMIIVNTSPATLYLGIGGLQPSTLNYSVALPSGGTFITGTGCAVSGVWTAASGGQANITEEL